MIIPHGGITPIIAPGVFIAPTAVIIGEVEIAEAASVWFGAVLRGDHGRIVIGRGSNVQDNVTLHAPENGATIVEQDVTIGHGAVLEGCVVKRGALIGINAVILHGAEVGEAAMIAAGCVVTEGMQIPPRTLAAGVPAIVKKELDGSSLKWVEMSAPVYRHLARGYMKHESLPASLHYLGSMTWPEVAELAERTALALVPTGATEAHGPHLPLETDVIIAQGSCRRAANLLAEEGVECAIAPPVYYGVTNFGMPFAGTVTIPETTLTELVVAVCRSLARHGFTRIVFSNHHLEPAHFAAIKEGARQVEELGLARVAVPDVRDERWAATLTEEFRAGSRHAGSYETSLVMAERPDLVREEKRRGLTPVWIDLPGRIRQGARTFKEAGSEWAYFGDPDRASVEEGEMIFAALARMIATSARELGSPAPA